MKALSIIFVILSYSTYCNAQIADQRISELINKGDYIELNKQYPVVKDSLSPILKAISESCIEVAFNKPTQATMKIDYLLKNYAGELGQGVFGFISILTDQLSEIGEYAVAADILKKFIHQIDQPGFPKEILEPLKSSYRKCNGLRNTPKSEIVKGSGVCKVKMDTRNKGAKNHLYIPVEIHGSNESFIFDTGAGRHLLSESFAKKHNVQIVADSVLLSGFGTTYTKIGVIDSLKIGNILYCNAVFSIAKDDDIMPKQARDSLGYMIDAVLGVEFMKTVEQVKIYPKTKTIEFSESMVGTPAPASNMMFANGLPYVEVFSDKTRFILSYDTGAKDEGNILYKSYKQHLNDFSNLKLDKESITRGSLAGVKTIDIYKISDFPLRIGNKEIKLKNFTIEESEKLYDGTLGLGFFNLCDQIVLNFDNMTFVIQ